MTNPSSYKVLAVNATTAGMVCALALGTANAKEQATFLPTQPSKVKWGQSEGSRGQLTSPLFGLYRTDGETVMSQEVQAALQEAGMLRLAKFRELQSNWDRRGARSLDEVSVQAMSEFFRDTGLKPTGLGVFMSPEGHLAVNWEDSDGNLVELEFLADRVLYFFEKSGEEGQVARNDIGVTKLFQLLKDSAA
ncbi:MAG: hypothetical protein ACREVW_10175 [Burkholderiales bacterium]